MNKRRRLLPNMTTEEVALVRLEALDKSRPKPQIASDHGSQHTNRE